MPLVQSKFDWTSPAGLERLETVTSPYLDYTSDPWQLVISGLLMNSGKALVKAPTGSGKTDLIILPALAGNGKSIYLVVSPTNALESDMVNNLAKRGLKAVALNSETLAAALLQKRDLWKEATEGVYSVVFMGPEMTSESRFNTWLTSPIVQTKLAHYIVDESHIIDEWGTDFRKLYGNLITIPPRLSERVSVLALSASVELGRQTERVQEVMGFRDGNFHFEQRDCERACFLYRGSTGWPPWW